MNIREAEVVEVKKAPVPADTLYELFYQHECGGWRSAGKYDFKKDAAIDAKVYDIAVIFKLKFPAL